ncbi:hypothetical protein [Stenotrophomonas maltophilia]|uniref:hypothetical protein n=1 Tax=Stenotrophomonas maltophilia TaxID=40324 RepID=UPI00166A3757|nr:hypothetical protein [Stenotrophomonas maltophilia]
MNGLIRKCCGLAVAVGLGVALLPFAALGSEATQTSGPIVISAFSRAHQDFGQRLKAQAHGTTGLDRHLADIDNYKAIVYLEGSRVVVQLMPLPYGGSNIRGGGGKYIVEGGPDGGMTFEPYR